MVFEVGGVGWISKITDPKKNRLNLPGSSQQLGEGLTETLTREVMEETGFTVRSYSKENALPLVLTVKAELLGFPELDNTSYMNWKVNDEKPTCP
ncbi:MULTISPECIES: hypothetical protein [Streptococcus]|uniref:Nudix hydrolase domain-containing protein n=1 Tax=Streptococcus humanilactis TaxID=2841061 RepID=A0ABS7DSB6_9STRE|nr:MULTISPECIES: hypothetical protein [Streptococcus]MBW7579042.1 hypothetical protein [Streptococcus humanilactis]MBW7580904.1 hypothetical protein [Streptococcus humanilactis]MDU2538966.1 hypothetical protein [Streptococcus mitis]